MSRNVPPFVAIMADLFQTGKVVAEKGQRAGMLPGRFQVIDAEKYLESFPDPSQEYREKFLKEVAPNVFGQQ